MRHVPASSAHNRLACNYFFGSLLPGDASSAIREHLKGQTQGLENLAIEMLARGLSVRDIEDAFKDENGRLLLSKTAVSQLGERLWEDYQAFAQQDLSEYEISYLFVEGIAERLRPGAKREPVLAAWGFTVEGAGCYCI